MAPDAGETSSLGHDALGARRCRGMSSYARTPADWAAAEREPAPAASSRAALSERRAATERAGLRRVAAAVVGGLDPTAALNVAAEEVAELMGAEQGFVFRFEDDHVVIEGACGIESSPVGAVHGLLAEGVLPEVVRTRAPARVEGRLRPLGRENSTVHWIGPVYRSGIGAPVFVGETLWGAMVAGTTRDDRFPRGAEGRLAYFADIAGIAIGTAQANAALARLAMSDPLTGLANHAASHSALASEFERARRHGRRLSLALIDVDRFKEVNDTHGHLAGDRVLVELARRLESAARLGDTVGRVGGEEFAWILPETHLRGARVVAERVREAVRGSPFPAAGRITVSIGVAEIDQAGTAPELYRLADEALYWAKRLGRDRCHAHGEHAGVLPPRLAGAPALAIPALGARMAAARGWS
jgi:diguanylate cyclase (GGDEF)-like protein